MEEMCLLAVSVPTHSFHGPQWGNSATTHFAVWLNRVSRAHFREEFPSRQRSRGYLVPGYTVSLGDQGPLWNPLQYLSGRHLFALGKWNYQSSSCPGRIEPIPSSLLLGSTGRVFPGLLLHSEGTQEIHHNMKPPY